MMRVLLTSFEPFDGRSLNSSLEVGRALAAAPPEGVEFDWLVLPVVAGKCLEQAWERIESLAPALVLALGQAAGTDALHVEQQAVNVHDFVIPDNAGNQPRNAFIHLDGPAFYPATVPTRRIVEAIRRRDIPVRLSTSAGTYVCNHLLYGLLHRAARLRRTHQTGFIHLPLLLEQAADDCGGPALVRERIVEGIRAAIAACLDSATSAELAGRYLAWEKGLEDWDMVESQVVKRWEDRGELKHARRALVELLTFRFPSEVSPEVLDTIQQQPSLTMLDDWFKQAMAAPSWDDFLKTLRR